MNQRRIQYNKLIPFVEKWTISIFLAFIFLSFSINKVLLIKKNIGFIEFDNFLLIDLYESLLTNESTLTTISSVFIGIYFTILTLLSSVNPKSTFSMLTQHNYKGLVKYIRNAFLGSFIFLFFLLFSSLLSNKWLISLSYILLLLYVLLSALRFAILIYLILQRDIDKYHEYLIEEQEEKEKRDQTYSRLESFLDYEERKEEEERSIAFSKQFESQNK